PRRGCNLLGPYPEESGTEYRDPARSRVSCTRRGGCVCPAGGRTTSGSGRVTRKCSGREAGSWRVAAPAKQERVLPAPGERRTPSPLRRRTPRLGAATPDPGPGPGPGRRFPTVECRRGAVPPAAACAVRIVLLS